MHSQDPSNVLGLSVPRFKVARQNADAIFRALQAAVGGKNPQKWQRKFSLLNSYLSPVNFISLAIILIFLTKSSVVALDRDN